MIEELRIELLHLTNIWTEQMGTRIPDNLDDVTRLISLWPVDKRLALMERLLAGLKADMPAPKKPLRGLLGVLTIEGAPPTDEQIDRMLDERRMRKHG